MRSRRFLASGTFHRARASQNLHVIQSLFEYDCRGIYNFRVINDRSYIALTMKSIYLSIKHPQFTAFSWKTQIKFKGQLTKY